MKIINYLKLSLDILMVLVFALLFNTRIFSGLEFHETAGLVLGGVFVIHLLLNGDWVKLVTQNLLRGKLSLKTKIGYIVNVLLLMSMGFILVSGVMISKTLLVGVFKASNIHLFQELHIVVSYVSLLLVGIHLGLNWSWVMNTVTRIFRTTLKSRTLSIIGIVFVLVLGFSSYTMYWENYSSNVSKVESSVNQNQRSGERSGLKEIPSNRERDGSGHFEGGHKGGVGASAISVLITHLGIISVFSGITFYAFRRRCF